MRSSDSRRGRLTKVDSSALAESGSAIEPRLVVPEGAVGHRKDVVVSHGLQEHAPAMIRLRPVADELTVEDVSIQQGSTEAPPVQTSAIALDRAPEHMQRTEGC